TTGTWRPSPWSISTNTASGWPRWGRSVSRGRETASGDAKAAAQSTFTPEIAARMRNRSSKTAPNLQHGKYQDLIRGSLDSIRGILSVQIKPGLTAGLPHPSRFLRRVAYLQPHAAQAPPAR